MRKHFPFDSIFLAGLAAGILIMNFGKSILLDGTGLLDESALRCMKGMAVDSNALFAFVLRKRLGSFAVLSVMATTYLGLFFCGAAVFWYGLSAGAFAAAGVLRFGVRGVLFILAALLPQYLLYVPAFYALLLWCEEVYRSIYRKRSPAPDTKTPTTAGRVFHLLLIGGAVLLGCAVESFANPAVFMSFLKIL